ncbi:hypothetical protein G6F31_018765 [Rhizopus arrhizus]|nr:hypothetical protein G6F31_018765 [Rhizopus arrhizus]
MDSVTQQNAALVEEAAASAASLETQAQRLREAVAVFKLQAGGRRGTETIIDPAGSWRRPPRSSTSSRRWR